MYIQVDFAPKIGLGIRIRQSYQSLLSDHLVVYHRAQHGLKSFKVDAQDFLMKSNYCVRFSYI